MPDSVDAATVRRWCAAGLDALRRHQAEIDALNVYPVPDGDTGTNLVLTMSATVAALDAAVDGSLGEVLRVAARGALLGARGNSGIILAQFLKGLAEALAEAEPVSGARLAAALEHAALGAYAAVAAPVEGTVLSVGAAAARAAQDAAVDGGLVTVARAAAQGARAGLARTPEQLPALARAGVVDAGGRGLVVLLDALVQTLTGEIPAPVATAATTGHDGGPDAGADRTGAAMSAGGHDTAAAIEDGREGGGPGAMVEREGGGPGAMVGREGGGPGAMVEREAGSDAFAYEVQYLLEAEADAVEALRGRLSGLGDSLVVVGDAPIWHIHVHVNDVGAAIETGIEAGRPSRITVTRFADQIAPRAGAPTATGAVTGAVVGAATGVTVGATADANAGAYAGAGAGAGAGATDGAGAGATAGVHAGAAGGAELSVQRHERAVVVVCSGPGLGELLAAEGATVLTGTPSTGEILGAIKATGAGRVVVLPNDPNVHAVAAAAAAEARSAGIRAGVVPTRSPVQALAAMAVRDARRRFEDDVIAMAEAAARCRSAEVTIASREALTVAGRCQPGDVLAIVDGEVNLIGQDLAHTACLLLDRMLTGGGELVTLIAGQGATAELGETLRAHVAAAWPFVEVQCYEGGQPHYPLLVGVE